MHRKEDVERYVAGSLPPEVERDLRAHLASCTECRAYYDEQRRLLRALAGDLARATPAEKEALIARVLTSTSTSSSSAARPLRTFSSSSTFVAAVGAIAAVVLFVVLANPSRNAGATPVLAARVLHAHGATADGRELVTGASILSSQAIVVAGDGALEVAVERGGSVRGFPGARLSFAPRGESIALDAGKVWCLVDKGKGDFSVRTITADVHVLGTSFIVDANDDGTDVRVVSGTVRVNDVRHRDSVTVRSEQGTHVGKTGPPEPVHHVSTARDVSDWQRFFERLLEQIKQGVNELKERLKIGTQR